MEWTAEGGTLHLTPPKGHQVGMHIAKAYLVCDRNTPCLKDVLGTRDAPEGAVGEDRLGRPLPVCSLGNPACCDNFQHRPMEGTSVHKHFQAGLTWETHSGS